ncbi:DUF4870 domain-containing protein [Microbacterium sp. BK668]|uniref:DUF4870 domain-containing protein n=1 Tax=Microbacterium sp. BK668 TaxID=2512118 RepID=UPI0010E4205E|nr:hypothetical protein EV279_0812 [Microbacterium sp. BK668]
MTYPDPAPYGGPTAPMNPSDEKLWAVLINLGGIFLSFFPALIGYLLLKDRGPFIRAHTATALNFQLTLLIAYAVGGILSVVLIGIPILIAAGILAIVFPIIAAVKAGNGQWFTYPLSIPFVR